MQTVFVHGPVGAHLIHCFDGFMLDVADARLTRDGCPVWIAPKAFDLLAALCACAGHLMSEDALLDAAWPGRVVGEGGLKSTVTALRQVLGDDPLRPRYIETVHRRGYRFIAPIESRCVRPSGSQGASGPAVPANLPFPLAQLLGRFAGGASLLVTLEDLRWRDDATLEGLTLRLSAERGGL